MDFLWWKSTFLLIVMGVVLLKNLFSRSKQPGIGLKRQLANLTIPIFIETLLIMTLGAVDTLMLSRYSDASVAAVGVVNQVMTLCFLVFEVINIGTSVLVSQYLGARLHDRIIRLVGVSLVVNLVVGLLMSLLLYFFSHSILSMMGLTGELLSIGIVYLDFVAMFAFVQAIFMTASATLRASNMAYYPMIVIAIVNVFNIFGNYSLIFGHFGFPALGVKGAAISTVICRVIAMVLMCAILFRTVVTHFPWYIFRRFPLRELMNLLKVGIPSAGEMFSYSSAQVVMTMMITLLGMEALAARTYVVNTVMFGYIFCIAISQGGAITIGHLIGKGKEQGAYLLGRFVLKWSLIITVSLSLVIALSGHVIMSFLTSDLEIIKIASMILWIDVLVEVGRSINIFATNALRSTGDVNFPFYVGLVAMWTIQVFGGYMLGVYFGLGIAALWAMIALDELTRGVIFVNRWNSFKWANKGFVAQ